MNTYPVTELFVAPNGRDSWTGRFAERLVGNNDGPLKTLAGARDVLRQLRSSTRRSHTGEAVAGLQLPVTVWLAPGRYDLSEPIIFTPDDVPAIYRAQGGEVVLDGGTRLGGWQESQDNHGRLWTAPLPSDLRPFRQLWVNGERATRSRWPKEGYFHVEDPLSPYRGLNFESNSEFKAFEGDIPAYSNLHDVDVLALHFWFEEHLPIESFDPQTRVVKLRRGTVNSLIEGWDDTSPGARYFLSGGRETLIEAGQWCLDSAAGQIFYRPCDGETLEDTEIVAPRLSQLLILQGDTEQGRSVEGLQFEGLTFSHAGDALPGEAGVPGADLHSSEINTFNGNLFYRGSKGASAQAACDVPGVIYGVGARHCAFNNCTIEHIGWYGFEFGDGCVGNRIDRCTLRDVGAGGVHLSGAPANENAPSRSNGGNSVVDCAIERYGRLFFSGCGILVRHSHDNFIAHNHIHDGFYTAISVGWQWSHEISAAYGNRIEWNHLHNLGQGVLSDMGGVYLLGVAPGTIVRGNHIYDISSAEYGGWAIYPDEGSSHVIIEQNLCHDTGSVLFNQHFGRENIVRNNIFAWGGQGGAALGRTGVENSITFTRNIFLTRAQPMFLPGYGIADLRERHFESDLNLFWDDAGPVVIAPQADGTGKQTTGPLDFASWQASNRDLASLIAAPGFVDAPGGNWNLNDDSPARKIGFLPWNWRLAGPRPLTKKSA
jgi:hypothetical protein